MDMDEGAPAAGETPRSAIAPPYEGPVTIHQDAKAVPARARISVGDEDDGGGWTIVFRTDNSGARLDPTRLLEVEVPGGAHSRFVQCSEPASSASFGVGLGWPPTRTAFAY